MAELGPMDVVSEDSPLERVVRAMLDSPYRAIAVSRGSNIVGVLTLKSLVRKLSSLATAGISLGDALRKLRVSDLPMNGVVSVEPGEDPLSILRDMVVNECCVAMRMGGEVRAVSILDVLLKLAKELRGYFVSDVASSQVWWSLPASVKAVNAFAYLSALPHPCVAVIDEEGDVVGLFTAWDFLRKLLEEGDGVLNLDVYSLSSRPPLSVETEDAVEDAVAIMHSHRLCVMPVVDPREGFAGVVNALDLARLIMYAKTLGK